MNTFTYQQWSYLDIVWIVDIVGACLQDGNFAYNLSNMCDVFNLSDLFDLSGSSHSYKVS